MATVHTIGHSTRETKAFIRLLSANGIHRLVDIRTVPGSRHNPQFNADALAASLEKSGISYVYMRDLGGLRPRTEHSVNTAWHNLSFRNYADYMRTGAFVSALNELIGQARLQPTAIMCAEAVPWRCHRSLVADALTVRGWHVWDIISEAPPKQHQLTSFASVDGTTITYPSRTSGESEH